MLSPLSTANAGCYGATITNNYRMAAPNIKAVRRQRFNEFRRRYNTDAEAASKLGITSNYYSQIKNGRRDISEETARKFEQEAQLNHKWFDGLDEAIEPISERERTLIRRFRRTSTATQDEILGWLALQRMIDSGLPPVPSISENQKHAVHEDREKYSKSRK